QGEGISGERRNSMERAPLPSPLPARASQGAGAGAFNDGSVSKCARPGLVRLVRIPRRSFSVRMSANTWPRLARRHGEFKDHHKSRSRPGDEAEVLFAPKSASSRLRLPFVNTPWPRWFAVTLIFLSFAAMVFPRAAEQN